MAKNRYVPANTSYDKIPHGDFQGMGIRNKEVSYPRSSYSNKDSNVYKQKKINLA